MRRALWIVLSLVAAAAPVRAERAWPKGVLGWDMQARWRVTVSGAFEAPSSQPPFAPVLLAALNARAGRVVDEVLASLPVERMAGAKGGAAAADLFDVGLHFGKRAAQSDDSDGVAAAPEGNGLDVELEMAPASFAAERVRFVQIVAVAATVSQQLDALRTTLLSLVTQATRSLRTSHMLAQTKERITLNIVFHMERVVRERRALLAYRYVPCATESWNLEGVKPEIDEEEGTVELELSWPAGLSVADRLIGYDDTFSTARFGTCLPSKFLGEREIGVRVESDPENHTINVRLDENGRREVDFDRRRMIDGKASEAGLRPLCTSGLAVEEIEDPLHVTLAVSKPRKLRRCP